MTGKTPTLFCLGRCPRASRRSCAFCANVAVIICDGERCIRPICMVIISSRSRRNLCSRSCHLLLGPTLGQSFRVTAAKSGKRSLETVRQWSRRKAR